jgi:hypothetical protein
VTDVAQADLAADEHDRAVHYAQYRGGGIPGSVVVVMSARPGGIVQHIRLPFAEQAEDRDSPTIKARRVRRRA